MIKLPLWIIFISFFPLLSCISMNVTITDTNFASLSEETIDHLFRLWKAQFLDQQKSVHCLPDNFIINKDFFTRSLTKMADSPYCAIAKHNEKLVGHMIFSDFLFHGEKTAICPIMGHSALKKYKKTIYHLLYQHIAQKLVENSILSHLFTYFADDTLLYTFFYELGFGMIVIDAFRDVSAITLDTELSSQFTIRLAEKSDIDSLMKIDKINTAYYSSSPIFLGDRNDPSPPSYYESILSSSRLYLAFINSTLAGFMNIRKVSQPDFSMLLDNTTSSIDQMGAFVLPEFRSKGIGKALLSRCISWAKKQNTTYIHVDFESANILAKNFWLKYFRPCLFSVRRRVYEDIL